jgi:hypothetical protein
MPLTFVLMVVIPMALSLVVGLVQAHFNIPTPPISSRNTPIRVISNDKSSEWEKNTSDFYFKMSLDNQRSDMYRRLTEH